MSTFRKNGLKTIFYKLRMFFATASYINGPLPIHKAASRIGQAEVIEAKHATNSFINYIY